MFIETAPAGRLPGEREKTKMKEYAVYPQGTNDNDMMDWFCTYKSAFEAAEEMAKDLAEGKILCLSEVIDGDFEDFPLEFRMGNGELHQYKQEIRLWA